MTIVPARFAELRLSLSAKRETHPELRRPLTLAGLRRVLKRESVELSIRPHPRLGELVPLLGRWLIIVDRRQPKAAWLICAAHELAHLWLHHDAKHERSETVIYDSSPVWFDQARELEADCFAEMMVRGQETADQNPTDSLIPYKAVGKRRRKSAQLELSDPDGDAFLAMVKRAPKDLLMPADTSPTVQFAIPRDVWSVVRLEAARYPHYDNAIGGPTHQLVTCGEASALAIVEQLARAGHKRTAARIRRAIRESRKARA